MGDFANQFANNDESKEQARLTKLYARGMEGGEVTALAIVAETGSNASQTLNCTLGVVNGALRVATAFCGDWKSKMDASKGLKDKERLEEFLSFGYDSDRRLFAALLAWASLEDGPETMSNTMGPPVFLQAAEAFEKIKGYKPDCKLHPFLAQAMREWDPTKQTEPEIFIASSKTIESMPREWRSIIASCASDIVSLRLSADQASEKMAIMVDRFSHEVMFGTLAMLDDTADERKLSAMDQRVARAMR